jgi:phosphoadenosine phosphosulfate reductase
MLQLSPGKDSAACLWLLEQWWGQLTVVWCNAGNPYDETMKYMHEIAQLVPNFVMVKGNQPEWVKRHGYPVDILPFEATELGSAITRTSEPRLQPFWQCCSANMWQPLNNYVRSEGFTAVIRGQKTSDGLQGPISSGDVIDGVEYVFPIARWSDADVHAFLGPRIPASYTRGLTSSLDCKDCTAYLRETKGRVRDLERIDRDAASRVTAVHLYLTKKCREYGELLRTQDGLD